jgi:predicted RNase H-like nuclease (RuvC/YqgF family)
MTFPRRLLESGALLLVLMLAACQTPPPAPAPPPPAPVCPEPPPPPPPEVDELRAVLAYATELRTRSATEAAPAAEGSDAAAALRRALVLSQGRGSAELAQAAAQLELVASATEPQAESLRPLAALLAARLAEQRRLQEMVDRLNLQLRDNQRRTDQLNEKLEALKAIEQTLPGKR